MAARLVSPPRKQHKLPSQRSIARHHAGRTKEAGMELDAIYDPGYAIVGKEISQSIIGKPMFAQQR